MPRGYSKRPKARKTSAASGYRSTGRRSSGGTKRRSGGRTGRAGPVGTIRIELVQSPAQASLANPALPIPPSVRTDKSKKAKL